MIETFVNSTRMPLDEKGTMYPLLRIVPYERQMTNHRQQVGLL